MAFHLQTERLVQAPIVKAPKWNQPFELMCDTSDWAVGLGCVVAKIQQAIPSNLLCKQDFNFSSRKLHDHGKAVAGHSLCF